MKNKTEIQQNLAILCSKRLKLRYRKLLAKSTKNCTFSRLCNVKDTENNVVVCDLMLKKDVLLECDDSVCEKCSSFDLKNNKQSIEEGFLSDISNPQICGQKEPKIAVLLWVLQEEKESTEKQNWLIKLFRYFQSKKPSGSV